MSHQQAGPDREPARRFIAADHARAASPYANVSSAVHKTLPVARRTAMCRRRKNVIAGPLRSAVRRPTAGLPPRRTLGCERGLRRSVGQQRRPIAAGRLEVRLVLAIPRWPQASRLRRLRSISITPAWSKCFNSAAYRERHRAAIRRRRAPCTARRGTHPGPGHHSGSVT
jgi:hypothetical protein